MAFALYVGGALIFSAVAVLAVGTTLAFESRWRRMMVPALYILILVTGCVTAVLSSRQLFLSAAIEEPSSAAKWITRLAILATLTICTARVAGGAFSRENRGAGGTALLVAFAVYFLTTVVLTSVLGRYPEFKHDQYYVPFLFAAAYASRADDPERAVRFAKVGFLIFLIASWLVALVHPDLVIQRNYSHGWIPGVTVRFWGLENSPNHMGPAALSYLLLALHQPFERRSLQRLGLALGIATLLAAQSKTAWSAAALAIPLLLVLRSGAWGTATFSLMALGATVSTALLVLPMSGVSIAGLTDDQQIYEALRLSGRDDIWALAVQEWRRNPLFGYGLTMWDRAYQVQVGMDHAVSAHNQFLQTLSVAGTIGLIGLVLYLGTLSLYAIRAWHASRGLSVALLTLVLVRCMTEPPVTIESFLGSAFVTHLLLFQLALTYGGKARSPR